jgi:rhamnose transport system substrate-binding protein
LKPVITFIPKSIGNPYFNSLIEGFRAGCKALNAEFNTVGPASAEAASQIPFVTAELQRNVNVLAIAPNSPTALTAVLQQARHKGILVLSINSDLPGNQSLRDAAILPVDFAKVGPAQLELLGSLMQLEGEFALVSATVDAPDQNVWIEDIKKALRQNPKYARMKLVTVVYGDDDPRKSAAVTQKLLDQYPDLKGLLAPTAVGLAAAAQCVVSAGLAERIKVTGLGTPNHMRTFLHKGTVSAFQLWNPHHIGTVAAHFAVGVQQGKIRNAPGKSFKVVGLDNIAIHERQVIYTQAELTTFDRTNIDRFSF